VRENEVDEDVDVTERRKGGMEMEVRVRTGERGIEENAEGKCPEKRGVARGCKQDRKCCIFESKLDELSRKTTKGGQQWTEKDSPRHS
jgi:hypothetical protein